MNLRPCRGTVASGVVVRSHARRSVICAACIGLFALNPGCTDGSDFTEADLVELLAIANDDSPFEFEFEGKRYRVELELQRSLQPLTRSVDEGVVNSVVPVTADIRLFRVETTESSELLKQEVMDGDLWIRGPWLHQSLIVFDGSGRVNGIFLALRSEDAQHFQLDQVSFHMQPNVVFFKAQRADP